MGAMRLKHVDVQMQIIADYLVSKILKSRTEK
jgi:hypothetical protein